MIGQPKVSLLWILYLLLVARPATAADAITQWTLLADRYGGGFANWRTIVIMHQAMHDALNAARPVYARWAPALQGEPAPDGATPETAMVAAARHVLDAMHPERRDETARFADAALARAPAGPQRRAAERLGNAIGAAAVARRANDGWSRIRPFKESTSLGQWRPTPDSFGNGRTTDSRPYLFSTTAEIIAAAPPPPALGSPRYLLDKDETKRLGGRNSATRTPDQTAAAIFWAYQSSQRGYIHLAVTLLDEYPRPGGVAAHARVMSQVAAGLADSAVLVWAEKEYFSSWRPITAIRQGGDGGVSEPGWEPLVETPSFPEYPSGHATDCFVGAGTLQAAFPDVREKIVYFAVSSEAENKPETMSMGQHWQGNRPSGNARGFPSLMAAARNCAESRIWAGAHPRSGNVEAERLAGIIVAKALAAVRQFK